MKILMQLFKYNLNFQTVSVGTFLFVFGDNSVIIHLNCRYCSLLLTSDRKSSAETWTLHSLIKHENFKNQHLTILV